MAKDNDKNNDNNGIDKKSVRSRFKQLTNLLGQANLSLYGTDRNPDSNELDNKFQEIISSGVNSYLGNNIADSSSFLANLASETDKDISRARSIQFRDVASNDLSFIGSQLEALYENRMREQSDLSEVSKNLIELSEAILITRDAIVSAESVEGKINRILAFTNKTTDSSDALRTEVEMIEDKFKLADKIKNFIVPQTLTYGEYYGYVIPYSELFKKISQNSGNGNYGEATTLKECVTHNLGGKSSFDRFVTESVKSFKESINSDDVLTKNTLSDFNMTKEMKKEFSSLYENIEINNDDVPLPIIENGVDSISEAHVHYMMEANKSQSKDAMKLFNSVTNSGGSDGAYIDDSNKKTRKESFKDIKDCYIKLIDPTKMIPIKIMDEVLGYYYVVSDETTPLHGVIGAKVKNNVVYGNMISGGEKGIVDDIADQVVSSFDKKFLKKNIKFKKLIVDAINYHNITENKIRFQYIPAEYVQTFKIDCDVDGNGQSMIKKSLFYAKLYLTLLMFKMISIVNYSNDIRVSYLKNSGISKDVSNYVQELARQRQSRRINMYDLFSLTTMANKIGSGSEMVVPMTASGDKPIETEILSGQEVQLNTDFMEMLKNSYILGTGVPAAILNFLNESDFAKTVEQNNTKYHARVLNYQLDLNEDITEFYKKILRYSTSMDTADIENFKYTFTQPRSANESIKAEAINNFITRRDFITTMYLGEPNGEEEPVITEKRKEFNIIYAKQELPQLRLENAEDLMRQAEMLATKNLNKPDPSDGLGDDDIGLEGMEDEDNEGF